MKEFMKKHLRPCRKVTDQFVLGFIVVFLLVLIGQLIGEALTTLFKNSFFPSGKTPGSIETGLMYGSFIGIWFVLILVMLLPKNRPMLKTLGRKFSGNNLKMSLFGLLLGFGMNAICVAISILNHDVALYFYDFNIGVFLLLFVAVFIQSAAEELAMRSYYYEKLRRRYRNPILAFIFTAVGFSLLHVFNPNMSIYKDADILFSIRPPAELQEAIMKIRDEVNATLIIKPLFNEDLNMKTRKMKLKNYNRASFYIYER